MPSKSMFSHDFKLFNHSCFAIEWKKGLKGLTYVFVLLTFYFLMDCFLAQSFLQPRVVERHFLNLRKKYGNVLAVDLVNKHGGEGRLSENFSSLMQHVVSDDVRYLHFDFHHICGHVHFERLSMLYDQIENFLVKNRYLLLNEKSEKVEEQLGVVGTNCIDCLNRTNVTQSMLGQKMLEFQLGRIGIFDAEESISTNPNFDDNFKICE
ncbi:hypothetical protein CsSME_00006042 [Camellia sinensis var. sinensis]